MNNIEPPLVISAEVPDWSREKKSFFSWDPSRSLLASIRSYQHHAKSRHIYSIFLNKCAILRHELWSVITGAHIPISCQIDGGLLLPHPNGIVIHPDTTIGPNCLIFQQVTIGVTHSSSRPPTIGGHVDIGAGAKILGPVVIGDHVRIGANAVVTKDVPSNKTARSINTAMIFESK
jgi:serine O-acetyltransferase